MKWSDFLFIYFAFDNGTTSLRHTKLVAQSQAYETMSNDLH